MKCFAHIRGSGAFGCPAVIHSHISNSSCHSTSSLCNAPRLWGSHSLPYLQGVPEITFQPAKRNFSTQRFTKSKFFKTACFLVCLSEDIFFPKRSHSPRYAHCTEIFFSATSFYLSQFINLLSLNKKKKICKATWKTEENLLKLRFFL